MNPLFGLLLLVFAGTCLGAEATYRWVDDQGVTNYGEKPPANRPATLVNTSPSAIVETGAQFSQKAAPRPVTEEPQRPTIAAVRPPEAAARGMDFDVYIRVQRGMTEGELLLRAGKPDYQSVENMRHDIVKSFYYFPTVFNPFTTVVTLRGGRVHDVERIKKF